MNRTLYAISVVLIVALAWGARTWRLGERPMHADEANQAVKLGALLERGAYRFDPRDHHGPTLYYAACVVARFSGEASLAELREETVRTTTAIAGVAAVVLVMALAAPLGRGGSCAAGLLLAVAPASVYYSRYFIQESLLVAFTLAAGVAAARWNATRRAVWAVAAGAGVGLMLATKASALLYLAAAAIAVVSVGWRPRRSDARAAAFFSVSAVVVAVAFYSSFGRNLGGVRDALVSFGLMAERAALGAGHEKAWHYYARLHLPQRNGGVWWDQSALVLLAVVGALLAWVRPRSTTANALARAAAVMLAIVALAMSLAPYKTPWQVANFAPWLAVLAAAAITRTPARVVPGVVLLCVTGWLGWQTWRSSFRFPADARNPFAYVHSSPDVVRVTAMAARLPPESIVRVIGREYWPLPWYLRGRAERVGYWATAPENGDGGLVICSEDEAPAVRARMRGNYREGFLGLRPGVLLVTFEATGAE